MVKKLLKFVNKHAGVMAGVVIGLLLAIAYGLSWLITCGLVKLITMCFGWTFSWAIGTGVWLIMCLVKSVFNNTAGKK